MYSMYSLLRILFHHINPREEQTTYSTTGHRCRGCGLASSDGLQGGLRAAAAGEGLGHVHSCSTSMYRSCFLSLCNGETGHTHMQIYTCCLNKLSMEIQCMVSHIIIYLGQTSQLTWCNQCTLRVKIVYTTCSNHLPIG